MGVKSYRVKGLREIDYRIRMLSFAHPSEIRYISDLVLDILHRKKEEVRVSRADRRDNLRSEYIDRRRLMKI